MYMYMWACVRMCLFVLIIHTYVCVCVHVYTADMYKAEQELQHYEEIFVKKGLYLNKRNKRSE